MGKRAQRGIEYRRVAPPDTSIIRNARCPRLVHAVVGTSSTHTTDALDEIYRCHSAAVFRRARRLMGSDADAQDVFLSLFERPAQYAGRSAISTFLYSTTTTPALGASAR